MKKNIFLCLLFCILFTTFVQMKKSIMALAILALGLASCGSGSTESSAPTTDTVVVATDTTNAENDSTVKAIVVDTTVNK